MTYDLTTAQQALDRATQEGRTHTSRNEHLRMDMAKWMIEHGNQINDEWYVQSGYKTLISVIDSLQPGEQQ